MLEIVTMGETMIQLNAFTSGPLRYVNYFEKHAAGTESNVAVGTVRMGYAAGWISKLGDDELGHYIHNFLKGEGVDVSHVAFDREAPTGLYFVQRDYPLPGKSVIYYYRRGSAASRLGPDDVDVDYVSSAKVFHTTGITLALSGSCRKAVERAFEVARNAGVEVSFDSNIRLKLWSPEEARRVISGYIGSTDIVFTDTQDAEIMVGDSDPEGAAEKLISLGPHTVVVKLGDKGAYVATSDGEKAMKPAYEVPVIDTVGAGDAFDAAFLSCRLRGFTLERSLEVANAAGALCVTVRGDVEAIPTFEDVERFLAGKGHILR
ncbi:MAG: sugar kinase [Candidatus Bathyarchaeota archaeon]|nr:MAG: sugar kinase [Candidatus Bathyarchaeota archaeon]